MSRRVGDYVVSNYIGQGTYSNVYSATHVKTGKMYAIKVMKKKKIIAKMGDDTQVRKEISIQKMLNHPNIIKLVDVFETDSTFYMILEYAAKGELLEYINKKKYITREESLKYFQQIVYSLDYCVTLSISHRDVKPENLLLDKDNNIKLSDFGFARVFKSDVGEFLKSKVGSIQYMAPEVILAKPYDGEKCLVWSIGIILYIMLTGKFPFEGDTPTRMSESITSSEPFYPPTLSNIEREILEACLQKDPSKRPKLREIMKTPYFSQNLPPKYRLPVPASLEAAEIRDIDPEIVSEIVHIRLGRFDPLEERKVIRHLRSKKPSLVRAFYVLYERRRKKEPRKVIRSKKAKFLVPGKRLSPSRDDNFLIPKSAEGGSSGMTRATSLNPQMFGGISISLSERDEHNRRERKTGSYVKMNLLIDDLRRRSEGNDFSICEENSSTDQRKTKGWFHKLIKKDRNRLLEKKISQFISELEDDAPLYLNGRSDQIRMSSKLPLLELAEQIQIALDLARWKWSYPNTTLFIVERDSLIIRIKLRPLPDTTFSHTHRYASWKAEDPINQQKSGDNSPPGQKNKKWSIWRKKKKKQLKKKIMDEMENPEINMVQFIWASGDIDAFIEGVREIAKMIAY